MTRAEKAEAALVAARADAAATVAALAAASAASAAAGRDIHPNLRRTDGAAAAKAVQAASVAVSDGGGVCAGLALPRWTAHVPPPCAAARARRPAARATFWLSPPPGARLKQPPHSRHLLTMRGPCLARPRRRSSGGCRPGRASAPPPPTDPPTPTPHAPDGDGLPPVWDGAGPAAPPTIVADAGDAGGGWPARFRPASPAAALGNATVGAALLAWLRAWRPRAAAPVPRGRRRGGVVPRVHALPQGRR